MPAAVAEDGACGLPGSLRVTCSGRRPGLLRARPRALAPGRSSARARSPASRHATAPAGRRTPRARQPGTRATPAATPATPATPSVRCAHAFHASATARWRGRWRSRVPWQSRGPAPRPSVSPGRDAAHRDGDRHGAERVALTHRRRAVHQTGAAAPRRPVEQRSGAPVGARQDHFRARPALAQRRHQVSAAVSAREIVLRATRGA